MNGLLRRFNLRTKILALAVPALVFGWAGVQAEDEPEFPWGEILKPSRPELPAPREEVKWIEDLNAGLALAKKEGRPLFVTMRCIPCKQCSEFDADVLDGGAELSPLLAQFVTVRVTTMRGIDERILPFGDYQDLDLSWWGYFLSDEGALYGVYGGRDEVSDTTRISEKGLIDALTKVLAHHYDKRRADWDVDGLLPDLRGNPQTPLQLPGWPSWAKHGAKEVAETECLHCHQVNEVLRQPRFDAKKFDKQKDFWGWPFPENVGLTLDRDKGTLVTKVEPGSAADAVRLKPGDELGAAGGKRLFTQADFRGVLHRAGKGDAKIGVVWLRKGEEHSGQLVLKGDWRKTDLGWRKSVAEADIGANTGFPWPLACNDNERKQRGVEKGVLCIKPYMPKGPTGAAGDAGLKASDFVVAVNGEKPDVSGRAFLVWFRQKFEPGDAITLTVVDGSKKRREVKYKAPGRAP